MNLSNNNTVAMTPMLLAYLRFKSNQLFCGLVGKR
jgi:hypothetical protein